MPAKKRNESRFKPFLGRAFTLRQHKNIPCYRNNKERVEVGLKDFGEIVLIFDENNTRIKVPLVDGSFVWIPKFYLHEEVKNKLFDKGDNIASCIKKTLSLDEFIKSIDSITSTDKKNASKKIEDILKILRKCADDANPVLMDENDPGEP